jgi:hypothetical protein
MSVFSKGARAAGLAAVLAGPVIGCGAGSSSSPKDATAESIASAGARLAGRWVLVGYQPEMPLEPTLALLLSTQFERMIIQFDGYRMVAEGPGISVNRKYRVTEAYGDHFRAQMYDEFGVSYDSSNDFSGNLLLIHASTAPWKGTGTLRRVP